MYAVESIKQPTSCSDALILRTRKYNICKYTSMQKFVRAQTDHASCHVTENVICYVTGTDHCICNALHLVKVVGIA